MFPLVILLVWGTATELLAKPHYDLNEAHKLFKDFTQKHGKTYEPEEYLKRLEIFKQNLADINERNAMFPETVFGITRFVDMTPEELRAGYGFKMSEDIDRIAIKLHLRPEEITAPEQWDWRDHGAVTHVKNQGHCGSCWIFSATGAIEGQYAIKHNKKVAFSEQQGLDCIKNSNDNCMGGEPPVVMKYHKRFGVVPETDYPYTGKQGTCTEDSKKVVTKVTDYTVYQPDEETLKQLVYEKGPLSVGIDPQDFSTYHSGILKPKDCNDIVCHAVLLVGYGIENGTKYWIIKDSYGPEERDHGYVKLVRGINACSMGTTFTMSCTVESFDTMFPLFLLLVVGTTAIELFEKPYYDLSDAHNLFKNFVQKHGKTYDPEEYLHRLEIFKKSLIEINERNAIHAQSVFEVTRFADLAPDERYSNMLLSEFVDETAIEMHYHPHEITAPEQWDWRDHGAVTHVKDQGYCLSCWIFCATGVIESQYAIKHGKALAFSEQQSLDCITNRYDSYDMTGRQGVDEDDLDNCSGGWPGAVMAYHEKFGVVLEKDYPYKGVQSETCIEDTKKVITKVTGHTVLKSTDEETLKQLVYEKGPLSVAIDPMDLTFHKKGIVYPHDCSNLVCHGVLLVGYGVENGTKYWILKDSGGLERGDQGYFKLVRGINACTMGTTYTAYCTVA
ncbi:oryzain gamma chain-like [Leguminivora glycinivorella]|uniref:oryzain gamma chain-like n=1 Tax=Leguminivora glycinivorella TaxID=1035111 RepID=UPI00200DEBCC|nr:oryzain gamma chain-like [Leguminivora glycinivorella]